ncbi:MAG: hypothetical protein H6645_11135 [Caldilineaceae bacterium]|nr:hypothetical protein [Caldilineaceae bacterium]
MGRLCQTTTNPLRLVIMAGAAVAFCIWGDSLLYAMLPLAAPDLGISLPLECWSVLDRFIWYYAVS